MCRGISDAADETLVTPSPLHQGPASVKSRGRAAVDSRAAVRLISCRRTLTPTLLFAAAPPPKRQKCDHWTPCPLNTYAYRLLSGGGKDKFAKICFEDEL